MSFILLLHIIVLVSTTVQCFGADNNLKNHDRDLAGLAQKWNITGPSFNYSDLGFALDYLVSDFILDEMVSHKVYDSNCAEGGTLVPDNVLSAALVPDSTPPGSGDASRDIDVRVTINSEIIASSPLYSETIIDSQVIATVRFCHRFMLSTNGASPIEVNFRETLVTLTIDLTDGFDIENVAVAPKDKLLETANQVYQVEGYQCNFLNEPISEIQLAQARSQGAIIRVCVRPDEEARGDEIYMRSIDSFLFERDYGIGIGKTTQVAIENGGPAQNLLTTLDCQPGYDICVFETLLMAVFFRLPGAVEGAGVASMQFGSNNPNPTGRQRNLRDGWNNRNLQEEDLVAATAEFELDFELIPRPDQFASSSGTTAAILSYFAATITCVCFFS